MKGLHERMAEANALLAPYAVPYEGRLGRVTLEPEDRTRFPFQRDRDRIIHTQAFRRLQGKTQVFVAGEGDHYRTRLTHTMEVAQIGRDLARALSLNEDLTECIALAHDLGHPPFAHAGEESLDAWMRGHGLSFEHNEQSLRLVTLLEEHASRIPGLNLNREVLEGLEKHSKHLEGRSHTLEAQVVNMADEIAYTGHDCDDGLRAGFFSIEDISSLALAKKAMDLIAPRGTALRGGIIHLLVTDLLEHTQLEIEKAHLRSLEDVYTSPKPLVRFSQTMEDALAELRQFLHARMYEHPLVTEANARGKRIVEELCRAFERQPTEKILQLQKKHSLLLSEAVKDYVAGMTDSFARSQAMTMGIEQIEEM